MALRVDINGKIHITSDAGRYQPLSYNNITFGWGNLAVAAFCESIPNQIIAAVRPVVRQLARAEAKRGQARWSTGKLGWGNGLSGTPL